MLIDSRFSTLPLNIWHLLVFLATFCLTTYLDMLHLLNAHIQSGFTVRNYISYHKFLKDLYFLGGTAFQESISPAFTFVYS